MKCDGCRDRGWVIMNDNTIERCDCAAGERFADDNAAGTACQAFINAVDERPWRALRLVIAEAENHATLQLSKEIEMVENWLGKLK